MEDNNAVGTPHSATEATQNPRLDFRKYVFRFRNRFRHDYDITVADLRCLSNCRVRRGGH